MTAVKSHDVHLSIAPLDPLVNIDLHRYPHGIHFNFHPDKARDECDMKLQVENWFPFSTRDGTGKWCKNWTRARTDEFVGYMDLERTERKVVTMFLHQYDLRSALESIGSTFHDCLVSLPWTRYARKWHQGRWKQSWVSKIMTLL